MTISISSQFASASTIVIGQYTDMESLHIEISADNFEALRANIDINPELDDTIESLYELLNVSKYTWGLCCGEPSAVGDIARLQVKTWNYSKDVMTLASSKKVKEVKTATGLLFGIELEFNHTSHSLMDLYPLLSMGIFKEDSSVDGEYVTLPYTYSDMVEKITALSDSFDKLLSANDTLTPLSGVGMHIHLSRKGLSDGQLELLRGLFSGEFTPYISWLCERYPNRYCNYHAWCGNRYVALNESNKNTVEIRAFLSPVNAAGILRNLKLVNAWLELANMSVDEWEVKYPEFAYDADVISEWWECRQPEKPKSEADFNGAFSFLFEDNGDCDGDNRVPESTPAPAPARPSLATSGWEVFD